MNIFLDDYSDDWQVILNNCGDGVFSAVVNYRGTAVGAYSRHNRATSGKAAAWALDFIESEHQNIINKLRDNDKDNFKEQSQEGEATQNGC